MSTSSTDKDAAATAEITGILNSYTLKFAVIDLAALAVGFAFRNSSLLRCVFEMDTASFIFALFFVLRATYYSHHEIEKISSDYGNRPSGDAFENGKRLVLIFANFLPFAFAFTLGYILDAASGPELSAKVVTYAISFAFILFMFWAAGVDAMGSLGFAGRAATPAKLAKKRIFDAFDVAFLLIIGQAFRYWYGVYHGGPNPFS